MVVGRRSFPIGFRKLFRGELLNFGDEHYVYIYIYIYIHVWNTLKKEITKPQHEHPLTQFHTKISTQSVTGVFSKLTPSDVVVSLKFKLTNTQNGKSSSNHPFFGDLLVSGRLKLRYLCPFRPTKPTAPDKYHGESAGGAAQLTSKDLQFSSDDPKNLTTWQMAILGGNSKCLKILSC